ncbi:MAG: hypothetical protein LBS97_04685 [Treponema sp.]|nr:hypothetical protein [Treponema sp.]
MKYIDPKLLIIAVLVYVLTEIIKRTPVWEKLRKWAALYILVLAMLFTVPYCVIILKEQISVETIFLSLIQSVFIAGLNVLVYEGIAKNVKETIDSKKEGQ